MKSQFRILGRIFLVFVPSQENIIVPVHVVFNKIVFNPTDNTLRSLSGSRLIWRQNLATQRTSSSLLGCSTSMIRMVSSMRPRV